MESSDYNYELCSAFFSQSLNKRIQCISKKEFLENVGKTTQSIFYFKRQRDDQGYETFTLQGNKPIFIARFTDGLNYQLETSVSQPQPYLALGQGFYGWEMNGNGRFSWAQERASLLIRPIGDNQRELDLSFVINTTVTQRFIVTFKGKKHFDQIVENGNPVRINISTTLAHNVNLLEIESEGKFWKPKADPRKLYFQVLDIRANIK